MTEAAIGVFVAPASTAIIPIAAKVPRSIDINQRRDPCDRMVEIGDPKAAGDVIRHNPGDEGRIENIVENLSQKEDLHGKEGASNRCAENTGKAARNSADDEFFPIIRGEADEV